MPEKIKIAIGKQPENSGMDGGIEDGLNKPGFDHGEHMQKMLEGLKLIDEAANKNDMATIKRITQSLIGEETTEEHAEAGEPDEQDIKGQNRAEMMNKLSGMMGSK